MKIFALFFALLPYAVLSYTQCECYADTSNGYWGSSAPNSSCDICASGYSGTSCNAVTWACTDATTCHGHGTCDVGNKRCTCTSPWTGDFCDECIAGRTNYPTCDQDVCDATTTCTGHGTCTKEPIPCGANSCDADTEYCHEWTDKVNDAHYHYCVSKTKVGCGETTATQCDYDEYCTSNYLPACCQKGYDACFPEYDDGTARGSASCCHPSQTCCDGQCCDSTESCKEMPEPRLGWVDPADGTPLNYKEHYCSNVVLTEIAAMRVIVLPMMFVLTLAGLLAVMIRTVGLNPKPVNGPAIAMIVFAMLLVFTPQWPIVLLAALTAFFAMGCANVDTKRSYVVALVVEFLAFAIWCGGMGLGYLIVVNNTHMFPPVASTASGGTYAALDARLRNCAAYYGYFWYDNSVPSTLNAQAPREWDADTTQLYWGYCDRRWVAATHFFIILLTVCFITLMVHTGLVAYNWKFGGRVANKNSRPKEDVEMAEKVNAESV